MFYHSDQKVEKRKNKRVWCHFLGFIGVVWWGCHLLKSLNLKSVVTSTNCDGICVRRGFKGFFKGVR